MQGEAAAHGLLCGADPTSAVSWMPLSTNTRPAHTSTLPPLSNKIFDLRDVTQRTLVVTDVLRQPIGPILKGQAVQEESQSQKKCRNQHYWLSLKYAPAGHFNLGDGSDRLSRNAGNQIPIMYTALHSRTANIPKLGHSLLTSTPSPRTVP